MKNFFSYEFLKSEGLLQDNPRLLDLGSGDGKFSIPFINAGFEVTLVDKDKSLIENLKNHSTKVIESDIVDFSPEGKFDVIFMRNILPFIAGKIEVEKIVNKMFSALSEEGIMVFTLFGSNDAWANKSSMSFFSKEEFLKILPTEPYAINEFEGMGKTMKGDKKYWHIFSAIVQHFGQD